MDENNNEGKSTNQVKEVMKREAKSFGKRLTFEFLKWAAPAIGMFFLVLLMVGLVNAIFKSTIDSIKSAKEESNIKVAVGVYDSTILGAAEQVYQEQKDWTYWSKIDDPNALSTLLAPVELQLTNSHKSTCCASYVGCVLYVSGYCSSAELGNSFMQPYRIEEALLKNRDGWQLITNVNEIQPGDIVFHDYEGTTIDINNQDFYHVDIYAGDNIFYSSSQKVTVGNWKTAYTYTWAYRPIKAPRFEPVTKYAPTDQLVYLDENGEYKLVAPNLAELILNKLKDQKLNNELAGFTEEITGDTTNTGEEKTEAELRAELQDMIDKYIKVETNTTLPLISDWYEWYDRLFGIDGMIKIQRASAKGIDGADDIKTDTASGSDEETEDENIIDGAGFAKRTNKTTKIH